MEAVEHEVAAVEPEILLAQHQSRQLAHAYGGLCNNIRILIGTKLKSLKVKAKKFEIGI